MSGHEITQKAIELLAHGRSGKRKSGARSLRKLADARAGPDLLLALKAELRDCRTWEPQYEMICALGECGYTPAREFIETLIRREFEATSIYTAIGDALVRLADSPRGSRDRALKLIRSENTMLGIGALRGLAGVHAVPDRREVEEILDYAMKFPIDESRAATPHAWVAWAAAGWLEVSPRVRGYLAICVESGSARVRWTAEKALQGKYPKWETL